MKRKILFNAWLPELGFLLEDVAFGHGSVSFPFIDEPEDTFYQFLKSKGFINEDECNLPDWMYDNGEDWCTITEEKYFVLLQFTDKKDKVDLEIYDGDIVISFKKEYEDAPSKNTVEFIDGCWRLVCPGKNNIPLFNYNSSELEKIGNIYKNPELLQS